MAQFACFSLLSLPCSSSNFSGLFSHRTGFEVMSKTEVILTSNIVGLGAESDQVRVAAGYARNFLFPQRLAIPLTGANKRRIESLKQRRAEREAHEFNTMSELSKGVGKLICLVKVKTGEDGKMFGAVTTGMIADELKHQFEISLDKRKIHLEHPIRTLGDHEVELRLHQEVNATLKIRVESSTPLPTPTEAPAPEAKKDERHERHERYERRGRRSEAHTETAEKPAAAKAEAPERKGRPAKGEHPAKSDRPPRGERPARAPKGEKAE
jgi:large subunit ribosomal protein L9